jgi:hypothetical protein
VNRSSAALARRSWRRLAVRAGRATCLLALMSATAAAQPAAPPAPPPPAPAPPSAGERALLERGEISGLEHIGGGVAGAVLGFGIGQALQGRWAERGWVFTLGETAATVALVWGGTRIATHCPGRDATGCGDRGVGLAMGGAMALAAFRAWATLDAFIVPPAHNREVSALRRRVGLRAGTGPQALVLPYVAPARAGDGFVGGMSLRF